MGFQEAIKSFYRRYFDFSTRSSPSEYWWIVLFQMIVYIAFFAIIVALVGGTGAFEADEPPAWFGLLILPLGLFALANIIPGLAVVVRRLHDRNMSGWFYLLYIVLCLIPLVNLFVMIGFIVFMCLPGYPQENKWGHNPRAMIDTFS